MLALCGIMGIFYLALFDAGSLAPWLVISSIFAIQMVTLTAHEGAHLAVAVAFRLFPVTVELGVGDVICDFGGKKIRVVLKSWPLAGMVIPSHTSNRNFGLFQASVLCLAGPVIDLILFLFTLKLLLSPPEFWQRIPYASQLETVLGLTAVYLAYSHLSHFWPRTCRTEHGEILNDVGQVWELLKTRIQNPGATALYEAVARHAETPTEETRDKVYSAYQSAIKRCSKADSRNILKDYLCTTVLLYNLRELLDLADKLSTELLTAYPEKLTYKGTRGAILVERGESEAGVQLLEEVARTSSSLHDQSISSAFVALDLHRRGEKGDAKEWLERGLSVDANCPAVRRALAEIQPSDLKHDSLGNEGTISARAT